MTGRIFFSLSALALVCGFSLASSQRSHAFTDPEQASTQPLASTLADDNVEVAACELEVDCCGNLNCAPAPCPIFCI